MVVVDILAVEAQEQTVLLDVVAQSGSEAEVVVAVLTIVVADIAGDHPVVLKEIATLDLAAEVPLLAARIGQSEIGEAGADIHFVLAERRTILHLGSHGQRHDESADEEHD